MKSAVFYGKHDMRVEESPMPQVGAEDVLIQVKACGICGTDVHIYEGDKGAAEVTPPTILGHEFSGVVTEVGAAVTNVKLGDRVCIDPNCYCGKCDFCRNGIAHYCTDMIGYGTTVNGGFAEYCSVNQRQVYKLGDHTTFEQGAMTEPVACCLHGMDMCNIHPGSSVVVIGGGNFWRGRSSENMDRTRADHIGMLATTMNALAVADMLESLGLEVRVQTAIIMQQIAEPYIRNRAISHLKKGRVVIFGCGTGSPFFSTDTAATLRAVEIEADILLKATMVDGVYDKDPHKYDDAVRYSRLTFSDVLGSALQVMDSTAASMCRDNKMPMLVFDLNRPENIYDAVMGEDIGTVVSEVDPIATEV